MAIDKDGFEIQEFKPKYDVPIWNMKNNRAKAGETVIGKIIEIAEDKFKGSDGKERVYTAHTILKTDGTKTKTPAHAQLIGKLDNAATDDEVKIVYNGVVELPGGKFGHGYEVGIKKAKK